MLFSVFALVGALGLAQATVPSDLSSGFNQQINLQVSFSKDVSSGGDDGKKYDQGQSMYQPSFGLKDYSHVKEEQKFVIIAIDTTESDKRYMHYMHQDYQMTQSKNALYSQSAPYMGYWAPGYLGESGKGRSYSYMMYEQPDNFQVKNLPKLGDEVVVKDFVSGCGLQKAVSGISVTIDINQSSNDYNSYKDKSNSNGGYGSYWNYMAQYNNYNQGYNQQGQYGNQYQQGYNQYQYMGYNQGSYSTYQQSSTSSYQQQYQQSSSSYEQQQYTSYQQYTSAAAYSAPPSYGTPAPESMPAADTGSAPSAAIPSPAPPYPTGAAPSLGFSSIVPTGALPTSSSPAAAEGSPSPSPLVGAAFSFRERASGAVAAGAGMAVFAAVML